MDSQEPVAWIHRQELAELGTQYQHVLIHARNFDQGVPLYTSPPAQAVPDGFVLVPKDLTKQMIEAACDSWRGAEDLTLGVSTVLDAWDAMLSAAPPPGGKHE